MKQANWHLASSPVRGDSECSNRFFTDFTVIFSSAQPHLQLSTVKENPGAVVCEVSETASICFDKLDGAIEAFGAGVTDVVLAVVE